MKRVGVVEDEAVVARRLVRTLTRILGAEVEIVVAPGLEEARHGLAERPVDLLFLDLELRGRDGFRLLEEALAEPYQTIVVSAHGERAVRAFELGVTDFVAKPYTEERLRLAIERAAGRDEVRPRRMRFLAVRKGREVRPVPVAEVTWISGAGDYAELHLADGSTHLSAKTLEVLERLLPERFFRVHRSHIVDLERVEALSSLPGSRYRLRLAGGRELPVGRSRVAALRERWG